MTDDDATTVRVLPAELMRVLQGHRIRCEGDVVLRLFTAEEYLPVQHAAVEAVGASIGRDLSHQKVDLLTAVRLTEPLPEVRAHD